MLRLNAFTSAKYLKENWLRQYGKSADTKELSDKLRALPDEPSPDEVDAVFISASGMRGGANRVTRVFSCTNCAGSYDEVVQLDEEFDGALCYFYLCTACVTTIFRLLND